MTKPYREAYQHMNEGQIERNRMIRVANDKLRTQMPVSLVGGRHKAVFAGALAQGDTEFKNKVLDAVRDFNGFTEDNDPYGEHDAGMLTVDEERIMFKIDYYDNNFEMGSDEPWNHRDTRRLLTIFYASDY